jgi:hypothetical protein
MSLSLTAPVTAPATRARPLFRVGCENIPADLTRAEVFRFFTFPETDRHLIFQCRGMQNRLGFALLLGGVRLTGRFPKDLSVVSTNLIARLCKQFHLPSPATLIYPQRQPTRIEHMTQIRSYLGLRRFVAGDAVMIEAAVCQRVREGARLHELLADAEGALRQQQVVLPGLTVLDRLIGAARLTAEEEIFAEIVSWASLLTQQQTLILLRGDTPSTDAARLPPLQRLKQASGRASPEAFARELQNLARVREVLPDDFNLFDFNLHLINRFAEIVAGASTRTLQQFSEIKRIALVLCWLWRARSQMIDTSLVIGNELIAGVFRRARHAFERAQKKQQKRAGKVLKSCGEVMRLLLDASIPDEQLRAALFDRYSREKLDDLSTECRALAHPPDIVYLKELARSYSYVRKFSPKLLDAFALHAATEQLPLRAAIAYLREHKGVRTLDAAAPLEFVPAAWRPHVNPAPGVIDRPFYEMCLLDRLRQSLKSGAVHVPHSHAFQSLNAYLLSDEQWETKRATNC